MRSLISCLTGCSFLIIILGFTGVQINQTINSTSRESTVTNSLTLSYWHCEKFTHIAASIDTTKEDTLEKFRAVFKSLVENEKKQELNDPVLEFEGMILDETRSKMGRDFYDAFYQNWTAPDSTYNYNITITEQPALGRGTQITIEIDYGKVFVARLLPKYDYIQAVSQEAVQRCQSVIHQQSSIKNKLLGY